MQNLILQKQLLLIRPPGTLVPEGLMFCNRCFLFNLPLDLRAHSADRHKTLTHDRPLGALYNPSPKIWGLSPTKFWGQKHAKFSAILHNFRLRSRIYRNETRYPKLERHVISSDSSRVQPNKSVNFGPLSRK